MGFWFFIMFVRYAVHMPMTLCIRHNVFVFKSVGRRRISCRALHTKIFLKHMKLLNLSRSTRRPARTPSHTDHPCPIYALSIPNDMLLARTRNMIPLPPTTPCKVLTAVPPYRYRRIAVDLFYLRLRRSSTLHTYPNRGQYTRWRTTTVSLATHTPHGGILTTSKTCSWQKKARGNALTGCTWSPYNDGGLCHGISPVGALKRRSPFYTATTICIFCEPSLSIPPTVTLVYIYIVHTQMSPADM